MWLVESSRSFRIDPSDSHHQHEFRTDTPPLFSQQFPKQEGVPQVERLSMITLEHVAEMINSHSEDVLILDLRSSTQYATGHVAGALNMRIPVTLLLRPSFGLRNLADTLGNMEQRNKFESWRSKRYILVYHTSSTQTDDVRDCFHTIVKFQREGYEGSVMAIQGGFMEFKKSFPDYVAESLTPTSGRRPLSPTLLPSRTNVPSKVVLSALPGSVGLSVTEARQEPFTGQQKQRTKHVPTGILKPLSYVERVPDSVYDQRLLHFRPTPSQETNEGEDSLLFGLGHWASSKDSTAQTAAKEVEGLQNFHLGDIVSKGTSGTVYRALDRSTGETVAIKRVSAADLDYFEVDDIRRKVTRLAKGEHPALVKYHDAVISGDALYIISEFCEGGTLGGVFSNRVRMGKPTERLVRIYASQILRKLEYLHDKGETHGNLKGNNVVLKRDGSIALADSVVSTKHQALYWTAPELAVHSIRLRKNDIWSLGCTVIELLEGKPPYYGLPRNDVLFRIETCPHPPLPIGLSPPLRSFLLACFRKDWSRRASAKELLGHRWITGRQQGKDWLLATLDTGPLVRHSRYKSFISKDSRARDSGSSWDFDEEDI
ncbi:hypothetical protein LTR08_007116 [Meristemomyces frigidus]|nr:hypothetical protein LTR08_007116 [Meristemomyces frigidus]